VSTFTFARRTLDPGLFSDNADVMQRFYTDTVGLPLLERLEHDDSYAEHDPAISAASPPMRRGFTYITLVVHEAEECRDALIAAGASNSLRLMRLADRCLFAWLRDPHGNWIEILQYAYLSGELPDIDRIADNWDEVIAWRETGDVPVA
jgi:hypothetical protein